MLHSGRRTGGLLCASLALAATLALAAPLVHAHLGAAGAAQGLCGEHHPDSSPAPSSDTCSLCLAGAHAPATREPSALLLALPGSSTITAIPAPEADRSVARNRPGSPRAPPFPA